MECCWCREPRESFSWPRQSRMLLRRSLAPSPWWARAGRWPRCPTGGSTPEAARRRFVWMCRGNESRRVRCANHGSHSEPYLGMTLFRVVALEEHQVLPRQAVELIDEFEAVASVLFHDLRLAHAVKDLDRHRIILEPIFDQRDSAMGLEAFSHGGQHFGRI